MCHGFCYLVSFLEIQVAYKMLKWVTNYTWLAVTVPGQFTEVKHMCGKHWHYTDVREPLCLYTITAALLQ